jgi:hypothetical protein
MYTSPFVAVTWILNVFVKVAGAEPTGCVDEVTMLTGMKLALVAQSAGQPVVVSLDSQTPLPQLDEIQAPALQTCPLVHLELSSFQTWLGLVWQTLQPETVPGVQQSCGQLQ